MNVLFLLLYICKFLSTYIVLVLKIPESLCTEFWYQILLLGGGGIFDFNCLLVSFYTYVWGKILLV